MSELLPRSAALYEAEHESFRSSVRTFIDRAVTPNLDSWAEQGYIDRSAYRAAGAAGMLGMQAPERLGGGGTRDFRFHMVIAEELARANAGALLSSISLQNDVILPYLLDEATPEQQERYVPGCCSGELVGSIAMTEPGTGSDLRGIRTTARREGDSWVINGVKTFITSGKLANFCLVVARADDDHNGRLSMIIVDSGTPGFTKGRKLSKIGQQAQDTAELYFDDVRVPVDNLVGKEGEAATMLAGHLPQERMTIAFTAVAVAEQAICWAAQYVNDRHAFGAPLVDLQSVQFTLAELVTQLDVTRAYVDSCAILLNQGRLTPVDAAKAKWWATETQTRIVDRALQLFGGYGYMTEYPIAQAYVDSRVATIYGGTTEIMKHIIGKDLRARLKRAR